MSQAEERRASAAQAAQEDDADSDNDIEILDADHVGAFLCAFLVDFMFFCVMQVCRLLMKAARDAACPASTEASIGETYQIVE